MLAALLLLLSLCPYLSLQKKIRKMLSALVLYHKPFSPQATPLPTFPPSISTLYYSWVPALFLCSHYAFLWSILFIIFTCSSFKVPAQVPPSPRSFPDFSSENDLVLMCSQEERKEKMINKSLLSI